MRKMLSGLLAAVLALGLALAQPVEAKVYKMTPAERAAALKEKKQKRKKAKKSGKAAPGDDQGGWVEVKPSQRIVKKNRRSKVEEFAKKAEAKARKSKKAKSSVSDAKPAVQKDAKKAEKSAAKKAAKSAARKTAKSDARKAEPLKQNGKTEKKTRADVAAKAGSAPVEARKTVDKAATSGKPARGSASRGDRVVGRDYTGEHKVSASSTEVRRAVPAVPAPAVPAPAAAVPAAPRPAVPAPAAPRPAAPAPATSVPAAAVPARPAPAASVPAASVPARPAPAAPQAPQVRQEVQPGPLDASKPIGTDHNAGEGRF